MKKFDFYNKKDDSPAENFDPNHVFGGDNEEMIDELEDEESKSETPFAHQRSSVSSEGLFERAKDLQEENKADLKYEPSS